MKKTLATILLLPVPSTALLAHPGHGHDLPPSVSQLFHSSGASLLMLLGLTLTTLAVFAFAKAIDRSRSASRQS